MPKREGYLMEEIVEYGNIADSIAYVLRGRRHRKSPLARYIWAHRDWAVRFFQWQLWLGLFHPTEYREMEISEYGKERKFITNSGEMKQFLDKISHIEDGFPFLTTIRRVSFGTGKYKYIFS